MNYLLLVFVDDKSQKELGKISSSFVPPVGYPVELSTHTFIRDENTMEQTETVDRIIKGIVTSYEYRFIEILGDGLYKSELNVRVFIDVAGRD